MEIYFQRDGGKKEIFEVGDVVFRRDFPIPAPAPPNAVENKGNVSTEGIRKKFIVLLFDGQEAILAAATEDKGFEALSKPVPIKHLEYSLIDGKKECMDREQFIFLKKTLLENYPHPVDRVPGPAVVPFEKSPAKAQAPAPEGQHQRRSGRTRKQVILY